LDIAAALEAALDYWSIIPRVIHIEGACREPALCDADRASGAPCDSSEVLRAPWEPLRVADGEGEVFCNSHP